jgi:dihydrolipoamide dehydrogenase
MTYEKALRLTETPESMIVIGGGYIATELGYYMARMGTKVDLVVRSRMLPGEDAEIRDIFEEAFTSRFNVHLQHKTTSVSYDGKMFTVTTTQTNVSPPVTKTFKAASLFVATGVTSNADKLNLPPSIKLDANNFIAVDKSFRTGQPGVWAYGDCVGRYLFRHTANWEGEWLFKTLFEETDPKVRATLQEKGAVYPPIPHAVFSNPQVAGVGMTEAEARAHFAKTAGTSSEDPLIIGRKNIADVAMGAALRADYGMVKLIFSKSDRKLVGAHMIGTEASTAIHSCIAFMQMKATVDDMLDTIWIHPALCEVIREAARDGLNQFKALSASAK